MICFLSDGIHALSVEISCSAEDFSTEVQKSLSILRIELLKCRCEFTLIYGFLDLLRKLSAQFIQLLLVSFDIGQVLAQLTGGMCILLNRLQHCMNVVPQPSLELFQALIAHLERGCRSASRASPRRAYSVLGLAEFIDLSMQSDVQFCSCTISSMGELFEL